MVVGFAADPGAAPRGWPTPTVSRARPPVHHPPRHSSWLFTSVRVGYAVRALERRNENGAERIRPYRLHRYVHLVRPRPQPLHYSTDEPREPDPRQHENPSGAPARGRPRQRRAHSTTVAQPRRDKSR